MRRIFRYEVPVNGSIYRHAAGPIHAVGCRELEVVEFWALADPDAPKRSFIVVGTGHPLPDGVVHVHGAAVAPGGQLVWHLIEVES